MTEEIMARLANLEAKVAKIEARKKLKKPMTEEEWFAELRLDSLYTGIDIDREYAKMVNWCKARPGVQPTRRRFINWLNREDKPLLGRVPGNSRYEEELLAALKDQNNRSLPSSLSDGAQKVFRSIQPPVHWRVLQMRVLAGEYPFGRPPAPVPVRDFKAEAAGDSI